MESMRTKRILVISSEEKNWRCKINRLVFFFWLKKYWFFFLSTRIYQKSMELCSGNAKSYAKTLLQWLFLKIWIFIFQFFLFTTETKITMIFLIWFENWIRHYVNPSIKQDPDFWSKTLGKKTLGIFTPEQEHTNLTPSTTYLASN